MAIATVLNWRRSSLSDVSAFTRSAALGQRAPTTVEPIWAVDPPSPLGSAHPARPDVTTLAVLWARNTT